MENGQFISDLPVKKVIVHSYVNVYQRVCSEGNSSSNTKILQISLRHADAQWSMASISVFHILAMMAIPRTGGCATFSSPKKL